MPWGKYQGQPLNRIPPKYQLHVLRSRRGVAPELRRQIRSLLGDATAEVEVQGGRGPAHFEAVVRRWYREMCFRFHPDRGGSKEGMQALNEAHQRLLDLMAE
jgi:hypothetical protein